MSRLSKAFTAVTFATLALSLGACTANSDCCKEGEQGTQVNASVMSEKKAGCCKDQAAQVNASVMSEKKEGSCAAKSAECKDKATECKDSAAPK